MRLVEIHKAGGLIEAESLRAALLEAGIGCQLDGGPSVGMPGLASGWSMAPVGVVVAEADVERSQPVVDEWFDSLPEMTPTLEPSKPIFQYRLKTIFAVMTINALVCTVAYHLGKYAISIGVAAIISLLPANLMIFGYLRKRRRELPDG